MLRGQNQYQKKLEEMGDDEIRLRMADHMFRFVNTVEFAEKNPVIWAEIDISETLSFVPPLGSSGMISKLISVQIVKTAELLDSDFDPWMNLSLLDKLLKIGELRFRVKEISFEYDPEDKDLKIFLIPDLSPLETLIGWKIRNKLQHLHERIGTSIDLKGALALLPVKTKETAIFVKFVSTLSFGMVSITKLPLRAVGESEMETVFQKHVQEMTDDLEAEVAGETSSVISRSSLIQRFGKSLRFGSGSTVKKSLYQPSKHARGKGQWEDFDPYKTLDQEEFLGNLPLTGSNPASKTSSVGEQSASSSSLGDVQDSKLVKRKQKFNIDSLYETDDEKTKVPQPVSSDQKSKVEDKTKDLRDLSHLWLTPQDFIRLNRKDEGITTPLKKIGQPNGD